MEKIKIPIWYSITKKGNKVVDKEEMLKEFDRQLNNWKEKENKDCKVY
ncbi:MAG: hypothetical protein ACOC5T_07005 [Elusimicrobiota bacterium]